MANLRPPDGVKVLGVSELTQCVRALLEEGFPSVWVSGEVSNLARPSSGHVYFGLKDAQSQLRAVLYRAAAMRLRFNLKDGMEVIARGRLSVYVPRGEYQFLVEEVQPKGIGALELALRQLREKLFVRGYFAPERKKPLPILPRRVALVTSPSGAAVRDMLEILAQRWPACEVWVCPVRVQGEGAAMEIAAAIHLINRLSPTVDVMIVGRGGGSTEDLWAFNEEVVAHAIYESRIPVVSAVGHEIDVTIADLVADRRALTPTEAATLVVPHRAEVLENLAAAEVRLKEVMLLRLHNSWKRWRDLAGRRAFRVPLETVREQERRLDERAERLQRAGGQRLAAGRQRLASLAARLETLSPLNVLGRGYSLTRSEPDQRVLRNAAEVRTGDRLVTVLQHGRIISRVEQVEAETRTADTPASRPAAS